MIIDNNHKFLLFKRANSDGHYPGLLEFPGGKLDEGEEIEEGSEREIAEETNLKIKRVSDLSYIFSERISQGKYSNSLYLAIFSIARKIGGEIILSQEHSDYFYKTREEALICDLTPETRAALLSSLATIAIDSYYRDLLENNA